jgi:hypothetical protein
MDLVTSPIVGALLLAVLVLGLVRSALREARRAPAGRSGPMLAALLLLFATQVVARFVHG